MLNELLPIKQNQPELYVYIKPYNTYIIRISCTPHIDKSTHTYWPKSRVIRFPIQARKIPISLIGTKRQSIGAIKFQHHKSSTLQLQFNRTRPSKTVNRPQHAFLISHSNLARAPPPPPNTCISRCIHNPPPEYLSPEERRPPAGHRPYINIHREPLCTAGLEPSRQANNRRVLLSRAARRC